MQIADIHCCTMVAAFFSLLCSRDGLPVSSQVSISSPPWSCVQCQLFPISPQPLPQLWHRHNHLPLLPTGRKRLLLILIHWLHYHGYINLLIGLVTAKAWKLCFGNCTHHTVHLELYMACNRLVLCFFPPTSSSPLLFSWWSQNVVTYFRLLVPVTTSCVCCRHGR